ncbi:recombinase family protein [Cellulomonas denverensis]|uniref:recombinase family protein n=1 Tax=Cellulomonas denverensis TaxID=264297 RepID=UPI001945799C|nr:recombinase family protein [Cellulomonas denverensis]GIG26906.1 DNA-invertase [Cellulomonas denverensis]
MALLGYARVSTRDQDPQRQVDALETAGCDRIWVDHGVSGKAMSRPQWDELLAYARADDTIVMTELSRAGRTIRGLVVLADDLAQREIYLRSLTQGIDTGAGATGKLLVGLFAALAEIEREVLVERTLSGLAAARARGRVGGRPVVVDAERLAAARQLIDAGQSVVSVARTLGVGRSSLYRAIERERAL